MYVSESIKRGVNAKQSITRYMRKTGRTLSGRLIWMPSETDVIEEFWPDWPAIEERLPHRTACAIKSKARAIGFKKHVQYWQPDEKKRMVPPYKAGEGCKVLKKTDCKKFPNGEGCKIAYGVSVTGKDFRAHAVQFGKNTIRLFSEGRCQRIGRKKGKEAERRCIAEQKGYTPVSGVRYYEAIAEIECYKPGRTERWGTEEIYVTSQKSLADARRTIMDQTSLGRVCATLGSDANLTDGPWRWIN